MNVLDMQRFPITNLLLPQRFETLPLLTGVVKESIRRTLIFWKTDLKRINFRRLSPLLSETTSAPNEMSDRHNACRGGSNVMNRHERRKAQKNNKHRDRQLNPEDWVVTLAWYTAGNCWRLLDGKYGDLEHAGRGALIVIEGQLEEHYGEHKAHRMIKSLIQAGWEVQLIPSADMPKIRHEWEQAHPEKQTERISMADIEATPEELAAEDAVNEAIGKLVNEHKPEHLMFQLGIVFAQGLSVVPDERREEALEEFLYRLAKDCGIEFGERRQLSEEEQTQRRQYHAQLLMEVTLAAIQAGKAHTSDGIPLVAQNKGH